MNDSSSSIATMQEFSSVTASSYDAESLAPLLNDKAADGWSVVSIVAAGTNIVAYLQREADEHSVDTTPTAEDASAEAAPATEETAAASPFVPAAAAAEETQVDEPAGWATAPEQATTDTSITEPEPEPAAVAQPVEAEAAPAADSAVPAGWYADPSGRFELRYWDGAAWTEHVSRAGQQFTDPPVA